MLPCRGKQLFRLRERRLRTNEEAFFKFEIAQRGGAYACALGAVFAQRNGHFMGARY